MHRRGARLQRALGFFIPGLLLAAACGGTTGGTPPALDARRRAESASVEGAAGLLTPARLFALPNPDTATFFETDPDGSRRFIIHGMRLVERTDGRIERARELLTIADAVESHALPARLGGGFLFFARKSHQTLIWKAANWTAHLVPLAKLEFEIESIVLGLDRLYARIRSSGRLIAVDTSSGSVIDHGPLPASPLYGDMGFLDEWLGAVETPYQGVLVTFDAGASWRPLGLTRSEAILPESSQLRITTVRGDLLLDPSGLVRRAEIRAATASGEQPEEGEPMDEAADASAQRPVGVFGERPLVAAVLRGFPDSSTTAVVAENGAVGRVRLTDGKLLETNEGAFEAASCTGLALGLGFGFVCSQPFGKTTLYEYVAPLSVKPIMTFDEPRYVASSQNGAISIRGSCARSGPSSGSYCIRTKTGSLQEIRIAGEVGVERVAVMSDGRIVVIIPPRHGQNGFLSIIDAHSTRRIELRLPKGNASTRALLKHGLWLDGFVETGSNEVGGWVVSSGPFAGVRVRLDGKVKASKIAASIDRALISGRFGLSYAGDTAEQTVDGGFTWRPIGLPRSWQTAPDSETDLEQGCSRVGCKFGPWLRVGYSSKQDEGQLSEAKEPDLRAEPQPGGGRWVIACEPTGEQSAASLFHPPRRVSGRRLRSLRHHRDNEDEELDSMDWLPFLELRPPPLAKDHLGFDRRTEDRVELHAYVWGPRGADWSRVGRFQLRAADRFAVKDGVWSTDVSKSPWSDASVAAQIFGHESSQTPAHWRAELEPSGRAGAVIIAAAGNSELYLFEQGHGIVKVDTGQLVVEGLSGVVKVLGRWYLGTQSDNMFRVYRIDGSRLTRVAELPLAERSSALASTLVRTARKEGLGVWVQSAQPSTQDWFIYPVDPEKGGVLDVIRLESPKLANLPRTCDTEEEGWLLVGSVPEPHMDFPDELERLRVKRIEARLLASHDGLCIESMAAQADVDRTLDSLSKIKHPKLEAVSFPLTLTDRGAGGRRWAFRCSR